MTFRLRRKHQTILRHALTLTSLWLTGVNATYAQEQPRPLPPLPQSRSNLDVDFKQTRAKSDELLQVSSVQDSSKPKVLTDLQKEDDYLKIETEPPSRDKLFRLTSEVQTLRQLEKDFKTRDPGQTFFIPVPADWFYTADNPTLGPLWFQSRKSGTGVDPSTKKKGFMKIVSNRGVHAVGMPAEAAIISETVGTADMFLNVLVELGAAESQFGVAFRGLDPNTWIEDVDQIDINSFYYAVMSADKITIGKRIAGKDTVLKTAPMDSRLKFTLSVTCLGDDIIAYRDDIEVLRVADGSLKGQSVGVIATATKIKDTAFDNFLGIRYGGPFLPRNFAQTTSVMKSGSVHYNTLYFEQMALERYGHHLGNLFTPLVSHGLFVADALLLPYSIGKSLPFECHSNEGLPKAGECVLPFRLYPPTWDKEGIVTQVAITALAFSLLP